MIEPTYKDYLNRFYVYILDSAGEFILSEPSTDTNNNRCQLRIFDTAGDSVYTIYTTMFYSDSEWFVEESDKDLSGTREIFNIGTGLFSKIKINLTNLGTNASIRLELRTF